MQMMLKSGQISNPSLSEWLTLQPITHNSSIVFVPFRTRTALPSICGPQTVCHFFVFPFSPCYFI